MNTLDLIWIFIIGMPTIFLIIFAYIVYVGHNNFKFLKNEFQRQADKRGGYYNPKKRGSQSFTFPYKNAEFKVVFVPAGRYAASELWVFTGLDFSVNEEFYIFNESLSSKFRKKIGFQDIEIGDFEFDENYIVKTSNSSFTRDILKSRIIQKILGIKKYKPSVSVENNVLRCWISGILKESSEYDRIIGIALELYDNLEENKGNFKKSSVIKSSDSQKYFSEKKKNILRYRIIKIAIPLILSSLFIISFLINYGFIDFGSDSKNNEFLTPEKIIENPQKYLNKTQRVLGMYFPNWGSTNDKYFFDPGTILDYLLIEFEESINEVSLGKGDYYFMTGLVYQPSNESDIYIKVTKVELYRDFEYPE